MTHKILFIEDAIDTLLILEATFKGYETHKATSIEKAKELLSKNTYDLILLDIELPDGNGLEFLADIKDTVSQTPVIFLTGKNDFLSKAFAFSLEADDFIQKPFDPRELKIRVDAKIRKSQKYQQIQSIINFGPLSCNLSEQRIYGSFEHSKQSLPLTSIEFKILVLFMKTPNKIFTRGEILDSVWGDDLNVMERAVDVHVSNLRKKLFFFKLDIEAIIGSGYLIKIRPSDKNSSPLDQQP